MSRQRNKIIWIKRQLNRVQPKKNSIFAQTGRLNRLCFYTNVALEFFRIILRVEFLFGVHESGFPVISPALKRIIIVVKSKCLICFRLLCNTFER